MVWEKLGFVKEVADTARFVLSADHQTPINMILPTTHQATTQLADWEKGGAQKAWHGADQAAEAATTSLTLACG